MSDRIINGIIAVAIVAIVILLCHIVLVGERVRGQAFQEYYDNGYSQGYIDGSEWVWGQIGKALGSYRSVTIFLPSKFRKYTWRLGPGSPDIGIFEDTGCIRMHGPNWVLYYSETREGGKKR